MPPKLVNTKVIRGPFEWEQNVTGDCRPCDVLVPFTYVKNRVYVEADDKNNKNGKKKDKKKNERRFTEETRYEFRRCTCPYPKTHIEGGNDLETCPFNAIQRGEVLFPLHVYQDDNGKGFCVRAKQKIPKGGLICEYVGEIITQKEAAKRERNYSQLGLFYLHDVHTNYRSKRKSPIDRSNKIVISMQYKEYTIDATMCGNVARMLNHNCEPNVTTLEVAVVRDPALSGDAARVPKLPRVGFFATRDIEANEELCIDYSPGRRGDDLQEVMECFCGSRKCKGWLF
ncbi:set domain protein [Micromonas pusilla CCMP1545]|uniref:Set domain protein n=1 Tax=Micromonas pusilla (strain CCMP1545) TaxID=564608 RepID=C1N8R6_MICPC|nr:set domain protein [Micromonas pusilla CCMP1545]EEH51398.1 set domain protein [Micromonas pusilla CCMP1545]|eukprot:XP_003064493.1 set domain protein [Micromonas pusilla CCMP1545]